MQRVIVNTFFVANALSALLAFLFSLELTTSDHIAFWIADIFEIILLVPFIYLTASYTRIPYRSYLPLLIPFVMPGILLDSFHDWFSIAYRGSMVFIVVYCAYLRARSTGNSLGALRLNDFASTKLTGGWKAVSLVVGILILNVGSFVVIKGIAVLKEELGASIVFHSDGLYTQVKTFKKKDQTALVIGMLHLGDAQFYGKLYDWIPPLDSLVLLEGTTDKKRVNTADTTLTTAAKVLKKSDQMAMTNPNLEILRDAIYADVDVSEVSPLAQKYAIKNEKNTSLIAKIMMPDNDKAELEKAKNQYMLERNQGLMKHFDKNFEKYQTIAFTWGSGHSEYIFKALMERGYRLADTKEVKAFSFW